jgi:hypothetical protein
MVNQYLFSMVNQSWWLRKKMNIANMEEPLKIVAKTCGCKEKPKKVIYSFVDDSHGICIDKKDIISAELEACERLLKYAVDKTDQEIIKKEIAELKMALDLMH